jgi:N-acyl-D-amino-acid deacylase
VQISHIKVGVKKMWGQADRVLQKLDAARASGVDITADIYPYTYWQTTMRVLFPNKDYEDRAGLAFMFEESTPPARLYFSMYLPDRSLEGKTVAQLARERGGDPVDIYLSLMRQVTAYEKAHPQETRVESVIGESMREDDVARLLAWDHTNICSDGLSEGHPRGHGAFTRVLRQYVREGRTLTLEQGVYKMSGLAAKHIGLTQRGVIAPGAYADLVLFDPRSVADRATIENPTALSVGIARVWVNGTLVFQDGKATDQRPGQVIRRATTNPH